MGLPLRRFPTCITNSLVKVKSIFCQIKAAEPDIIVITGDLIDRRKYDLDAAVTFVTGASKIAPVYFVSGNHEAWLKDFGSPRLG